MNTLQFESVMAEGDAIVTAQYQTPFGLSRTVIVRLDDKDAKRFLVYSPGSPLLEQAQNLIGKDAELILVAPSLGHTLGLADWLKAYPGARVTATEATLGKLARQSLADAPMIAPEAVQLELPEYVRFYCLPDCTSGEIWVTILVNSRTYWLACDGVMNVSALSPNWLKRLLQRLYGLKLGLWITPTFRSNITDRSQFKAWFHQWLAETSEPVLIPCHGHVYLEKDLTERLVRLAEIRL